MESNKLVDQAEDCTGTFQDTSKKNRIELRTSSTCDSSKPVREARQYNLTNVSSEHKFGSTKDNAPFEKVIFFDYQNRKSLIKEIGTQDGKLLENNRWHLVFGTNDKQDKEISRLNEFENVTLHEVISSKKNIADYKLISVMVENHLKLPKDIIFKIITGDNAFRYLSNLKDCFGRMIDIISPHRRQNYELDDIVKQIKSPKTDFANALVRVTSEMEEVFKFEGNCTHISFQMSESTITVGKFYSKNLDMCDEKEAVRKFKLVGDVKDVESDDTVKVQKSIIEVKPEELDQFSKKKKGDILCSVLFVVVAYFHHSLANTISFHFSSRILEDVKLVFEKKENGDYG